MRHSVGKNARAPVRCALSDVTRFRHFPTTLCCFAALATSALGAGTAFDAVKLLPKEKRKLVALIEARDAATPERWHLLVCEPAAENGLREFVVENGAIVAERTVSQFAESLAPEQALGDAMRYDSDRAVLFAKQYAQVNAVTPAAIAYELRKDEPNAAPTWRVTCFDDAGAEIGELTISALKGNVISHRGFAAEPPEKPEKSDEKQRQKFQTSSPSQVAHEIATPAPRREAAPQKKTGLFQRLFGSGKP